MTTAAQNDVGLRRRVWSAGVIVTVLGSVLWPLTWPVDRDSFPLSNYPMFAWPRLTTSCTLAAIYAADGSSRRERLPPKALGRAKSLTAALDANKQLELLLLGDPDRLQPFCQRIAANVAGDPELRWVRHIEIVRDEYDSLAYHAGAREPTRTITFATCAVRS